MRYLTPSDPAWDALLQAAWQVRQHAHAPYSHFLVGAALLDDCGRIHVGCNMENASYGATLCAERNAMSAAVATGVQPDHLQALVVVTDAAALTPPCGMCLQVLSEFANQLPILLANQTTRELHNLNTLMPNAFTCRNL